MVIRITGALPLRFVVLGVLFLTAGCSLLPHEDAQYLLKNNLSVLRGYNTACRGSVHIVDSEGERVIRREVPAGRQQLQVAVRSELDWPQGYPHSDNFLCFFRSVHKLSFKSQAGKVYRLHVEQAGDKQFVLKVFEQLQANAPESAAVAVDSEQLNVSEHCRFVSYLFDCTEVR